VEKEGRTFHSVSGAVPSTPAAAPSAVKRKGGDLAKALTEPPAASKRKKAEGLGMASAQRGTPLAAFMEKAAKKQKPESERKAAAGGNRKGSK